MLNLEANKEIFKLEADKECKFVQLMQKEEKLCAC
jgi:hypothetical protein